MTYSQSLAVGRKTINTGRVGRNQNNTAFKKPSRTLGPVSNTVILIVLACLLGLLYLTQVTKTNAYGYDLSQLEEEQATLQEEREELEIASARLQSLDRAQNSEVAQAMVTTAPQDTLR